MQTELWHFVANILLVAGTPANLKMNV